jgi:group I intron endonuclease
MDNYSYFNPYEVVYVIKNEVNNRKYYGISRNPISRLLNHFRELDKGEHQNATLQDDFNIYGDDSFTTDILDFCFDRDYALASESELIKNDHSCYNISGNSNNKYHEVWQSKAREGRKRAKNQGKHLGRPSQPEKEIKRALKLYAEREKNGMSVNDIVKATGVPRSTIYAKAKKGVN